MKEEHMSIKEAIRLEPGGTYVLRLPSDTPADIIQQITEQLKNNFADIRFLVLPDFAEIQTK